MEELVKCGDRNEFGKCKTCDFACGDEGHFVTAKERENNIRRIKRYHCEVDFTCPKLNNMADLINYHMPDEVVKKSLLQTIEKMRESVSALRDWGHDLRFKLLEMELKHGYTEDKRLD